METGSKQTKYICQIAVISDVHDNWANLDKAIEMLKKSPDISQLILCGDVCAPITLKKIIETLKNFDIYLVYGNVDGDHKSMEEIEKNYNNLKIYGLEGKIKICGRKIGFTHFKTRAKKMAEKDSFDIIFYGHTHSPWEEKIKETILLNPGELTGFFGKSTFVIYDLEMMQAKLKICGG